MSHSIPINGDVLRDLRLLRMLSQEGLAHAAGCTREEISAYERGTRKPTPAQLDRIVTALERYPVKTNQWLLIKTPTLDAALKKLGVPMNRRELAKLLTAATAAGSGAVVLSPGGVLPPPRVLHEQTVALAARYPTTSPSELLPDARHHLNVLTDALNRSPLLPRERTGLLVGTAETASLAARCARLSGHHGEAAAFFALAQSLADESSYDTLRGLTRIAAAAAHGPLVAGGDGNWVTALDMITSAVPLIGASGPHAQWAQCILAEQYADLSRGPETMRALARLHYLPGGDSGEGFFSTAARLHSMTAPSLFDGLAGRCYGLLGHTDEALAHLARERAAGPVNMQAHHTDVMLTHACAGDPEPMSAAAHLGLDLALATSEGTGRLAVAEIRGARAKLPEPCADAACVRELDERLAAL